MAYPKYGSYQDYVFQNGEFVGEFEEMYKDYNDPWRQDELEWNAKDKQKGIEWLKKMHSLFHSSKVLEIGCGLGVYAEQISAQGFDVTGFDVSETAVAKASKRAPSCRFEKRSITDFKAIKEINPDVIVMAEVTWYILDDFDRFIHFLKREMNECILLHHLTFYEKGKQKFGREYFVNESELMKRIGMFYLDEAVLTLSDGCFRSVIAGTWQQEKIHLWNRSVSG